MVLQALFGSKNSRELKRMGKIVKKINDLEPEFEALDDAALRDTTQGLRGELASGTSLDALLPRAFAAVREAAKRTKGMRHFDVQMIGGITLHEGRIAEMRTGEGKTLMATLAAYLNALPDKGVHVVTVNDYLARRDAEWMAPVYEALGLSVGIIQSQQDPTEKHEAYRADITYGTNNEFGFDYLRDNMAFALEDKFQRDPHFAIVDEVDSILIDEARTPLIISGPAEQSTDLYEVMNKLAPKLKPVVVIESLDPGEEPDGDFVVDEKNRSVELTERGHQLVEEQLISMGLLEEGDSLYSASNLNLLSHMHAALKAHALFKRDVDYMVQGTEVVIVDEHTGRAMPGRRWSEGIHQAVEAKERVTIQNETQTLASTTFQNYFRLYEKLSGMTGTADTEAFEFRQIYGLDVVVIPTHRDMIRDDANDLVYLTIDEKYDAIVEDINDRVERGQPVLVGTASIESSERLSAELKRRNIAHNVLNAKQHEREAEAAQLKAEWEKSHAAVLEAGGLHIIGTERHESRRIDNQLRGRSGRQGDPGSSRFYLSMEDNLMRIFASDRIRGLMQSIGLEKGEAIEHRMVNNAIEKAQRKVEGHNFDIRKNLLEYDDVANDQRQVIYQQRRDLMVAEDISETMAGLRAEVVDNLVSDYVPPQSVEEQWDVEGLQEALVAEFNSRQPIADWLEADDELDEDKLRDKVLEQIDQEYATKSAQWRDQGVDITQVEKQIMLQVLDQRWKEHLATMDYLRQGIALRAYAQKQPKQEYKRESFELFQALLENIKTDVVRLLMRVQIETPEEVEERERARRAEEEARMRFTHAETSAMGNESAPDAGAAPADKPETFVRGDRKVGRNEPCPCGSGKKFKQCHGKTG